MADPKYANLPGIAHDQPDIYETGEHLPECDLHQPDGEEMSESVETLHVSASDAFGKFKGKKGPTNVDLSGRIQGSKGHWHGDYELVGAGNVGN